MARTTALQENVTRVAPAPAPPLVYRLLREPIRRVLERHFDFRVEGMEHLPAEGPVIIAANHHNYLDGVVLAAAVVPRRHPLAVRFGPARRFKRGGGRAARAGATQRIMDDIAALLC